MSQDLPWDILMVLYTNDFKLNITSIQADVRGPLTTTLRWLRKLEGLGYIERRDHPTDRRIANVVLTPEAREALDRYFEAI